MSIYLSSAFAVLQSKHAQNITNVTPMISTQRYQSYKRELASGRSARSGRPLSNRDRKIREQAIADYERRVRSGEQPPDTPLSGAAAISKQQREINDRWLMQAQEAAANRDTARLQRIISDAATSGVDQGTMQKIREMSVNIGPTDVPASTPVNEPAIQTPQAAPQMVAPQGIQNGPQLASAINQAWRQYATLFNQQNAELKPAMQTIFNTLKQLNSPAVQLTNEATTAANQLLQTIQSAVAEENRDQQFMSQVLQQAAQLSSLLGGNANTQTSSAVAPNTNPASQPATQQTTPSSHGVASPKGKGWGTGIGEFAGDVLNIIPNIWQGFNKARQPMRPTANTNAKILTAYTGSAAQMFRQS